MIANLFSNDAVYNLHQSTFVCLLRKFRTSSHDDGGNKYPVDNFVNHDA